MPRKARPPSPPAIASAVELDGTTDFESLDDSRLPKDRTFFVVIPRVETFKGDELAAYEAGHYSLRICEHLPEHRDFIDYLIDGSLDAWTRSPV